MSRMLTQKDGNIIAYWGRKPSAQEECAYLDCVQQVVREWGIDASVTLKPATGLDKWDGAHFGYDKSEVILTFNNAPSQVRTMNKSTVKRITQFTIWFRRTAGLFDLEKHRQRDKELEHAYETMSLPKFFEYCDSLPWDGDIFDYKILTHALERRYRHRHWEEYDAYGRYGFGSLAEIQEQVKQAIYLTARDLGLIFQSQKKKSA